MQINSSLIQKIIPRNPQTLFDVWGCQRWLFSSQVAIASLGAGPSFSELETPKNLSHDCNLFTTAGYWLKLFKFMFGIRWLYFLQTVYFSSLSDVE